MENDHDTVKRVISGRTDAFRLLVERYQRPLFALVAGLLGPSADVEDIAQDVFCAAYRHLASFDPARARFATWLFAIARNRCLNERKRRRPVPLGPQAARAVDVPPDGPLREREAFDCLDRALAALPVKLRAAFALVELTGLPHEEVARIEGVPVGTVKSRASRARARLRDALAACLGDEP